MAPAHSLLTATVTGEPAHPPPSRRGIVDKPGPHTGSRMTPGAAGTALRPAALPLTAPSTDGRAATIAVSASRLIRGATGHRVAVRTVTLAVTGDTNQRRHHKQQAWMREVNRSAPLAGCITTASGDGPR